MRHLILWLAVIGLASASRAADVAVLVDDAKPGTYLLTVGADGSISVNPIRVVRPGGQPSPSPQPLPEPSAFEAEVERQAKAALSEGGTLTTGAGLAEVYSVASSGVADNSIDHTKSIAFVGAGSAFVLSKSPDALKWAAFDNHVRNALHVLDSQGALRTKDDYANVLKSVANGLSRATGHKPLGKAFLVLDLSTTARQAAVRKANGILDGIDLVKLMEFIKFLVELFKLFAPK